MNSTVLMLFWMFFKVGLTSFGGGYGMMSMIMDEGEKLVGLTKTEFADMTALDFICSGPIALNASTYVGYIKGGLPGAVSATLGCILPSILVCLILLLFMEHYKKSIVIKGLFTGIKPACGGLLVFTALTLCKTVFFKVDSLSQIPDINITPVIGLSLLLAVASLIMDFKLKFNPILITLIGAVFGIIFLA